MKSGTSNQRAGRRERRRPPTIEIVIESPLWTAQRSARALLRRAIGAAASTVSTGEGEVAVVLTDDSAIRALNRDWRCKDAATNVLSFPAELPPGVRTPLLGDLILCAPVVAREAAEQHKALRDHYAHMTVHGVLHLLGYDHLVDADAERMEALERRALATLGIADPYA